uniref:Uncharacterized protein n=1 Tax=Vitis vinifera TaxID=29760 RepID=F6H9J3_VITVI
MQKPPSKRKKLNSFHLHQLGQECGPWGCPG